MKKAFENIQDTSFDQIKSKFFPTIKTIDMHTGGEPLRVVIEGAPQIKAGTVLEYRRRMQAEHDHFRKLIMWEPRGHADMYGLILLPPEREDSDFGVLFMHNEGYSTMCGHATIAIAKLAVMLDWVEKKEPVTRMKIDAPCGQIHAFVNVENSRIKEVYFDNVPSFVVALGEKVRLPGDRAISYDLAFGGAFYAYVDAGEAGLEIHPGNHREFIETGMQIKRAVMAQREIPHPLEPDLSFLYGTIFIGKSSGPGIHSRNVCIFANGEVDRSATGSGVSGRAAIHFARGEIDMGEQITIESIIGSTMSVQVQETVDFGPYKAVVPRVSGDAWVCGFGEFILEKEDPFQEGFLVGGCIKR